MLLRLRSTKSSLWSALSIDGCRSNTRSAAPMHAGSSLGPTPCRPLLMFRAQFHIVGMLDLTGRALLFVLRKYGYRCLGKLAKARTIEPSSVGGRTGQGKQDRGRNTPGHVLNTVLLLLLYPWIAFRFPWTDSPWLSRTLECDKSPQCLNLWMSLSGVRWSRSEG